MRRHRENRFRAMRLHGLGTFREGASGVNHVVHENGAHLTRVTDDVHHLGFVWSASPFIDDRQLRFEPLRVGAGSFNAARVGRDDHGLIIDQRLRKKRYSRGCAYRLSTGISKKP